MTKVFTDGLSFALPLLIMAVGAIYSEKSGVTNLAIEGFQGFGAFFGALAAILLMPHLPKSSQVPIYAAMLFAAVGGAIYACLHALLCINFKANQVISGVVVNILAVALTTFFTSTANTAMLGTASNKFILGVSNRYSIPLLSRIPWIGGLFRKMYPFEWIIIGLVVVCLIFGIAKAGGQQLCIAMKLSGNYTDLFNMLPYVLTMLLLIFFSKRNHPPQACGQPWDHSRR